VANGSIAAAPVTEILYAFSQSAFGEGTRMISKQPLEMAYAPRVFGRLATLKPMTAHEVRRMPIEQQRVLYEIIGQYIEFTTVFGHLKFPGSFLAGSSGQLLAPPVLAYFVEHRWPFPQRLPQ
jgi:hypothetical protein